MAPSSKPHAEPLKQKSLMSFFSKGPNTTPNAKVQKSFAKPAPKASKPDASSSQQSSQDPCTPESKSMDLLALNSSAMGSSNSWRGRSTPPTSDPIDVDMVSSDEDEKQIVRKAASITCFRQMMWVADLL
jgi:DNA mismatch repair protein MSH6